MGGADEAKGRGAEPGLLGYRVPPSVLWLSDFGKRKGGETAQPITNWYAVGAQ